METVLFYSGVAWSGVVDGGRDWDEVGKLCNDFTLLLPSAEEVLALANTGERWVFHGCSEVCNFWTNK